MSFNVNRFKQNLDNYGYNKNNKFEVFVQAPRFLQNKVIRINNRETTVKSVNDLLRYRIEQVIVPGVSLVSIDTNRYGIGPTQKMPYNAQFFDTTFSILVDRNTDLWDFWYNWTNGVYNFNGQEPNGNNVFVGGRTPTYVTEYKDNYSTTMMIVIYNDLGETVKVINLYEAFPSSIKAFQLAWNDNVNLMRLAISVTYSQYSMVGSSINNPTTGLPMLGAPFDGNIIEANVGAQVFGSVSSTLSPSSPVTVTIGSRIAI